MSKKVFISPSRYVQGEGVLNDLGKEIEKISKKALLISDETVWEIAGEIIEESFKESEADFRYSEFKGEASDSEINRLIDVAKEEEADAVIGLGGGKTLDTAKAIANELELPVIIAPTTASTDAPTSALSVIYSDEGVFEGYKFYDRNPDLVIVDTKIIVGAPIELFAAGMADAMATYVEARASQKRNADTMAGEKATILGTVIAQAAEETLFEYGPAAYQAAKEGIVTPHVEAIVEANTLLSGLGFENGGLAAAHAIHNGFTALDGDIHDLSHGEKVAYGILVQLVLEGYSAKEINRYADFFKNIGMPTNLKDIHLENASFEDLVEVGKLATDEGETLQNMNPDITPEQVANAIWAVNEITAANN